jgi:hypothetical protein
MQKKQFMRKTILGLTILILISCGNSNKNFDQNSTTNENDFVWDFSQPKKYIYSYWQEVDGTNNMNKDMPANTSKIIGNGYLNVRVKENNLADLSLTDLKMDMIMFDDNGKAKDTMSNAVPASVIQDMKPNSTFGNNNHNFLFDLIFPLPTKKLKVGEKDKIPMEMPFNANGSRLSVKGFNTLEFIGMEKFEGKEVAILKGDIDISNLEKPEELSGIYKSSSIGKGTYYFDLKNQYFVGADIQMTMKVLMDTETGEKDDMGMFAEMQSDNKFKIRLEKIEE